MAYAAVAETLFIGRFVTLDAVHPEAEAIAVAHGRIIGVGASSEMERFAGPRTRRISVSGIGLPGFADAHIHVAEIGELLERLDLRGLTKPQVLGKVSNATGHTSSTSWIYGEGWDEGFWSPATFPAAGELDAVSAKHPVVLGRIDGHSVWVNGEVLKRAGISKSTANPEGGVIVRDDGGQPTGVLVDNAKRLIDSVMPKPTRIDQTRRIRAALSQLGEWGLTSVHDASVDLDTIEIYKDLLGRGQLPVRVYAMAFGDKARTHYMESGPETDLGNGLLTVRSFKLFLDGALGSRGAELTEPYADAPNERGLELMNDADLEAFIVAARRRGFQVNVHAIGDRAVTRVLDAFERGGVQRNDRFRVEHASLVNDADLLRFARLGIVASLQPVFVGEYSRWSEDRIGPTRVRWVLRTRDFIDAGVTIASGTDFPDSDSGSPIATLHCLVTRQSAAGLPESGWYSNQRIDIGRALQSVTAGPAYAAFEDQDLGVLAVGRYADFTALSANPFEVAADQLRGLTVRMTVVGGRVTFDAATHR